mmetsp:Transcript_56981/g.180298  ORF Transcript_56981/g.180298 Transcript_56981/m.180298 type:complete len:308 (+) Transcript_56981:191-1114(+)
MRGGWAHRTSLPPEPALHHRCRGLQGGAGVDENPHHEAQPVRRCRGEPARSRFQPPRPGGPGAGGGRGGGTAGHGRHQPERAVGDHPAPGAQAGRRGRRGGLRRGRQTPRSVRPAGCGVAPRLADPDGDRGAHDGRGDRGGEGDGGAHARAAGGQARPALAQGSPPGERQDVPQGGGGGDVGALLALGGRRGGHDDGGGPHPHGAGAAGERDPRQRRRHLHPGHRGQAGLRGGLQPARHVPVSPGPQPRLHRGLHRHARARALPLRGAQRDGPLLHQARGVPRRPRGAPLQGLGFVVRARPGREPVP